MKTKTYIRRDISKRVASKVGATDTKSLQFVDAIFETMREMLCEDNKVTRIEVRNFGVLTVKPTKAKPKARNPRTNEVVYVPAHRKTHFRPGKIIKQVLRKPLE
ncbi:MAG: integration host factor subunit beta [Candidatus Marinimicrobia bacterium]|nr:integration host factor subunit beta [Candidatus Neomarinimicrobiota bacterium]